MCRPTVQRMGHAAAPVPLLNALAAIELGAGAEVLPPIA
jgi:hypothetical protein